MVYGRYYESLAALTCLSYIIRSFHEGMVARVQDQGQTSEPFSVTNGTKQGCVMAPLLFTLVFSAMLNDAFHYNDLGALIRFRTDGNVFNLRRLNSKTRTSKVLIRDLLFADDCALLAHTVDDIQAITNSFARSARRFGMTISLKKTEVIYQPKQKMSHAKFGDCITICMIHPKNAYYLLHDTCYNLPQGQCYNMPQRHLAHDICICSKIRCTLHLASYIQGSV